MSEASVSTTRAFAVAQQPAASSRRRIADAGLLVCVTALASLLVGERDAAASLLLPPAVGVPDTCMQGTTVAEPITPEAAMFANPAGLVGFRHTRTSIGFGLIFAEQNIDTGEPIGYEHTDHAVIMIPSGGISVPLAPRWRFGFGVHGITGSSLDFPLQSLGLESGMFAESAFVAAPFALAYELHPRLWVGAELVPLFGYLRNRFTLVDPSTQAHLPIHYSLRGPGVQAMFGATWRANDTFSFGVGIRTPGAVWMDGSTPVGGERRDVDLKVHVPTQISLGATVQATERLEISAAVRWTGSSSYKHSDIEFAGVEVPYVPDAQDEIRVGLAGAFDVTESFVLRGGASYASRIVGNEGISPILFDTEDVKLSAGCSWKLNEAYELHAMGGYALSSERHVSSENALVIPGEYRAQGTIFMIGVTRER